MTVSLGRPPYPRFTRSVIAGTYPARGVWQLFSPTSTALTANRAYYVPFIAPYTTTVTAMAFYCASGTNNHDIGLYDRSGNRLVSRGSTATTAAAVNTWTLGTPQGVQGGELYFAAMGCVSATPTFAITSGPSAGGHYMMIQGTAIALPATATFATSTGVTAAPVMRVDFAG